MPLISVTLRITKAMAILSVNRDDIEDGIIAVEIFVELINKQTCLSVDSSS